MRTLHACRSTGLRGDLVQRRPSWAQLSGWLGSGGRISCSCTLMLTTFQGSSCITGTGEAQAVSHRSLPPMCFQPELT